MNDDGPPNADSSPYLKPFVDVFTSPPFNHTVSVVIPTQQRSWIGKAHFLPNAYSFKAAATNTPQPKIDDSHVIAPTYYEPTSEEISTTIPSSTPTNATNHTSSKPSNYWVLVPGTPATCVQLGLFHHHTLFPSTPIAQNAAVTEDGPIDLVISGPNFGRNTSASFALSSGTLGGALEAAVVGKKAMAISFAHFRELGTTPEAVHEACTLSAKIVDKLWQEWGSASDETTPDLYSINIPLVAGLAEKPIQWTYMFNTSWRNGRLYGMLPSDEANKDVDKANADAPRFTWKPDFVGHFKFQQNSPAGAILGLSWSIRRVSRH